MFLGEGIEREALMKAFSWLKKNNKLIWRYISGIA